MDDSSIGPRQWYLLLALAGLVVLSWLGTLDTISSDYVGASLLDAGIIYGTARGINALVSALQGTELDLWLITFSVGELLDPVNDMIERFSGVMTIAITSLVIQQLLLVIVSDATFSTALTLLACATAIALVIGKQGGYRALLRTFLIVALLRFSLAVVVVANLWVDQAFLPDSNTEEFRVMQDFHSDLEEVDHMVRGEGERERSEIAGQFEVLEQKIDRFVDSSLHLMGALLLKAVIVPVLFLWALVLAGRSVFRLTGTPYGRPPPAPD
jgi:hypothetical protein